jgi:hypothetical protein
MLLVTKLKVKQVSVLSDRISDRWATGMKSIYILGIFGILRGSDALENRV